jgi:hypothetical protein
MARFATSILLALLLIDTASAVHSMTHGEAHEPPHGVRRMLETLENKEVGTYQCSLEARKRSLAIRGRDRVCRARW